MKKTILLLLLFSFYSCSSDDDPIPTPTENKAPTAKGTADFYNAEVGETILFDASTSKDDTKGLKAIWDFDGNKTYEGSYKDFEEIVSYSFTQAGEYNPVVKVKDAGGKTATYTLPKITITESEPENLAPTANGGVNLNTGKANETQFIFNANGSTDPENKSMTYRVDVDGDGTYDTPETPVGTNTKYKYTTAVNADPKIQVKDIEGLTSTYELGKVGIWATDADKPQINISAQNYILTGTPTTIAVNVTDPNGLSTQNDYLFNGSSDWSKENGGNSQTVTYPESLAGQDLEVKITATTPYHIKGEATKTIKAGSPIPHDWVFTDKADGKEYYAGVNDGVIWLRQNYAGSIGEHYNNDPENALLGKYLTAAEVDALEDVVMVLPDGREFETHVASAEEWHQQANAYGGAADLKYKEFANGENVGATNSSGMSLMLGGIANSTLGFGELGDNGIYMTSTDNDNGSKKAYLIDKNNTSIAILNGFTSDVKANIRLVIEN